MNQTAEAPAQYTVPAPEWWQVLNALQPWVAAEIALERWNAQHDAARCLIPSEDASDLYVAWLPLNQAVSRAKDHFLTTRRAYVLGQAGWTTEVQG